MVFTPDRIVATMIMAVILAIAWRFADREGRESMLPAAVLNWLFALVFAVIAAGGAIVYAVEPPDLNCCYVNIAGSWWCLGWWCAFVESVAPIL